jgi:hypothetical protein
MIEHVTDAMTSAGAGWIKAKIEPDIGITEEMISAAAEVLWLEDPLLDIPQGSAEVIAEKMLRRALAASGDRTREGDQ